MALHPKMGWQVSFEDKQLFWQSSCQNEYSSNIKPDIILEKGEEKVIIDTKWIQVDYTSPSEQDLRQLFAYCTYWKANHKYLSHPTVEDTESKIEGSYKLDYASIKAGILRLDVPKLINVDKRLKLGEELVEMLG